MTIARPPNNNGAANARTPASGSTARTARLLIIGTATRALRWARARLRQFGFELHTSDNGLHALQLAQSDAPDLIILDGAVPGVDMRFVLFQLRRGPRTSHVPILMLATTISDAHLKLCHELEVSVLLSGAQEPRARRCMRLLPAERAASAERRPVGQSSSLEENRR